jgi:hypothetical protein
MKNLRHASLIASSLLVLGSRGVEDELAFRVEPGTTLVRTLTQSTEMELESMTIRMNGEELPADMLGDIDMSMQREDRYVITDVFEAVQDGRPTRLRRTFDDLGGHESMSFSGPDGENSDESEYASELEGKSVLFTWNEEDGAFDVSFADDQEGDSELLEELDEDMDLRSFLPEGEIVQGESWEIDVQVFNQTMDPGGDLHLVDTDEEKEQEEDQFDENLSGEIRATYKGMIEEDGRRLAVIAIEAEIETFDEGQGFGGGELPDGLEGRNRTELTFSLAGELRWDVAGGHAADYELSGEGGIEMSQSVSGEMEGERFEQEQLLQLAGSVRFAMEFVRGE